MFLNNGVNVINFDEDTHKLRRFSSRKQFMNSNSIHSTLNQMIIEESSKTENDDEETPIQKVNKRFVYNKGRAIGSNNFTAKGTVKSVEETTSFQHVEVPKKSVISHRLRENIAINKRIRKRLINLSYKSWLRVDHINHDTATPRSFQEVTLLYGDKPVVDIFRKRALENNAHFKGKIMLYGLYKSHRDTRPHKCPYKHVKHTTHLYQGNSVFLKKNISPNLQKRCICEHFTIIKSPLK